MDEQRDRQGDREPGEPVPLDHLSRLDRDLDRLLGEHAPTSKRLGDDELAAHILAAQLRLVRDDVESPSKAFLERLDREVAIAIEKAERAPRRARVSRGGFLRAAATLAGGVAVGVAVGDGAVGTDSASGPAELVTVDRAQWYDIAAADEVPAGAAVPFTAGGVLGYLFNENGELHAVSAICTHMGCRLTPADHGGGTSAPELACLCHGSRFASSGRVLSGHAREPLPAIEVRVVNGRVRALGTKETV